MKAYRTGLVIAGLLALGDITTPFTSDGEHPPMVVGIICAALGLITAVALVPAWRSGSRSAVTAIIVTRLLSAATALPAFFVDGVPGAAKAAAALGVTITVLSVGLTATRLRRPAAVAA
ncbi:MAG TPA: hypothetical protein VFH03_04850 [Actinoplanes sp.]|nr:hypothetical protein [Actinoplanes sp.]